MQASFYRSAMTGLLTLTFLSTLVLAHDGDGPLPVPEHRADATAADFIGAWEGKWDQTWNVSFTITMPDADDKAQSDRVDVLYEWEESLGKPYQTRELKGTITNGVLDCGFIEIYLHPDHGHRATAIGRFKHERSAELTRAKPASTD